MNLSVDFENPYMV